MNKKKNKSEEIEILKLKIKDRANKREITFKIFVLISIISFLVCLMVFNKDELLKYVVSSILGSGLTYGLTQLNKSKINSS
jgi:hypothetical protein